MPFCDLHPHSFASSLPSRTVLLAMASPVHGSTMKRKASNASQAQDKKLKGEAVKRESDGAEEEAGIEVNPGRVRMLREGDGGKGPVVYWMCRDHRSRDNWALLYAAQHSQKNGSPLAVAFNLVDEFLEAKARHFGFMLRGLRIVQLNLAKLGIPFFLFQGEPKENIPEFLKRCNASTLVMDFSPLRIGRIWREEICASVNASVSVYEVDAHNVVPVWLASDKQEYSARTIRGKIQRQLPEFLVDYPAMKGPQTPWNAEAPQIIEWDALINDVTRKGADVPEIQRCEPGEDAALEVLVGAKNGFLTVRIKNYADDRNDPAKPSGLSGLSPYLHYGHISAQRCALEAHKYRKLNTKAIDAFLEELIIRRELADNFCYYQPYYDSIKGASEWARKTLTEHALDKREHIYLREELEKGKTHDELWNASQLEMVHTGKMHGFMRMYWAKKILEWTRSPEEALAISIYLNDKFELDGRDPNGYVGCMWSICGIHDQGWQERPIFGKIRYMNYNGCKRKFNVDGYIQYVRRLVVQLRKTSKQETKFGPSSTATKEASL